jgi:hypothetical protein
VLWLGCPVALAARLSASVRAVIAVVVGLAGCAGGSAFGVDWRWSPSEPFPAGCNQLLSSVVAVEPGSWWSPSEPFCFAVRVVVRLVAIDVAVAFWRWVGLRFRRRVGVQQVVTCECVRVATEACSDGAGARASGDGGVC